MNAGKSGQDERVLGLTPTLSGQIALTPLPDDTLKVIISTSRGDIHSVYHPSLDSRKGIIWICGAHGGLDGPSFGIYVDLSRDLVAERISSLRLDYRQPGVLEECVLDVLTGIAFLKESGITGIALVGHSFGSAVVISAGVLSPQVKAVVCLSSQTYGAHPVPQLSPRPLLLIHGEKDRNLPSRCSLQIYQWALQPKELVLLPEDGHFLRQSHQELRHLLKRWLVEKLETGAPSR